ncbi:MAG: hypothetical protein ISR82_05130 [Candidatus Marinimicrobia bacterium]|nr:hypothetical protein [Candidatus Neomarinimicrobiota bacterium]MBL7010583.1 hypothetical protein [Candidatus Neomarinimicrobiota bacterium]MBL7031082.1 hypothetical protein [Candidatus Neomarinimicrobiota bacterium]
MRRLLFITTIFSVLFAQNYQSEIQPIWDNNCTASCHNSGNVNGGLNLTADRSYQELVNVASQGYSGTNRVTPGDPATSVLYQKIVGNTSFGDRMPKGGSALAQTDQDKIQKWIKEGAKQEFGGTAGGGSYDFEQGAEVEVLASEMNGSSHFSVEFFIMFHSEPNEDQEIMERESNDGSYNDFFFEYNNSTKEFELSIDQVGSLIYAESNLMSGGYNGWHHVYFEYNNQDLNFFWNGNNVASVQGIPNLTFPTSSKHIIFTNFKGSIDGVRFRKASGFEGIPGGIWDQTNMGSDAVVVWNCNEILTDASINPNHNNQYLRDDSGKNNHGLIEGNGQLDGDVFGGTGGGGSNMIEFNVSSNESLSGGETRIGLVRPGDDANYWSNRSWDWTFGAFTFPGNYPTSVWNNEIPDENGYHLIVFYDENNDWILDDANEAFAISPAFDIQGSYANIGTLDLQKSGGGGGFTITVEVEFNEDYSPGQVWLGVWESTDDPATTQPIFEHQVGEDPSPPFPFIRSYGFDWTLQDGKSYKVGGFFDTNNNNMPDDNEPQGMTQDFSWPVSQPVILVMEDMAGPEIDANLTGISGAEGEAIDIEVQINSSFGVQSADIEYYVGGSSQMQISNMSSSGGDIWQGSIPSSDVTASGLLFEIRAEDSRGRDSFSGIEEVRVDFSDGDMASTSSEVYKMISSPGQLQNASYTAVLDELGDVDPTLWRFFRWTGNGYAENSGSFTYGKAYWLITEESQSISAGAGKSTPLKNPPAISLSSGWNMIATPFAFSVDMNDQSLKVEGDVEPALYEYNGSSYSNASRLNPGKGVWVYANESASIQFDFISAIQGATSKVNDIDDEIEGGWKANIIATAGHKQDQVNVFGTHPSASEEWDKYDRREPPVIGEYISVAFENGSWNRRSGRYSQDIRPEGNQTQSWNLTARTNIKGIVSLSVEDLGVIPMYQDIRLVDTSLGIVYDLRSKKEITFTSQGTENPYYFQLMVGSANEIQDQLDEMGIIPNAFELAQNTPNPFNPVTNIRVSLVEEAIVTLKVYNLLGEEMNTLALNRSLGKGNHRFIWAGKDDHGNQLPSGVYLYRMEVNSPKGHRLYQSTKKMILMK